MKTIHKNICTILMLSVVLFTSPASESLAQIRNVATDATDPDNERDTEPSIAVNPLNPLEIVITTFAEGWSSTTSAPVWRSTDGGTTWAKEFILPMPGTDFSSPGDQKLQFDPNGNLIIAELANGLDNPRCVIFRQTGAAGTNLTPGDLYGDDQPMLDVDKTSSSAFAGNLYSAWLDFAGIRQVSTVARSTDNGANADDAVAGDNATFSNRTSRTAVGADGSVYLIFKTREGTVAGGFENAHFRVKRSDDGGANWNAIGAAGVSVHGNDQMQTWFTTQWGNTAKGKVARARSSDAWIATDPDDGDVYAVYCDRDDSNFGQIFLARSRDRGVTWTTSRITDGSHHSAYPEVAVASNGTVGVLYVDFDDSGDATIFRHRFARSFDNGASWTDEILQQMDPEEIDNASSGFLWGDYEGLTAEGLTFYGVFTGESIDRSTRQLDPIFFKRSAFPRALAGPYKLCDRYPDICTLASMKKDLIQLKCIYDNCKVFDPIPKNCLYKYDCPGCSPAGLCPPPFYIMKFLEIDPAWDIKLFNSVGKEVKTRIDEEGTSKVLTFVPGKDFSTKTVGGGYYLLFSQNKKGLRGKQFNIKTSIQASDTPYKKQQFAIK